MELGLGVVLGGAAMAVAFVAQYAAGWIAVQDTARTSIPATPFVLAFAGQIARYLGGSFFEELFTRSYLLRMTAELARGSGAGRAPAVLLAAVITSLLFGAFHLFNPDASLLSAVNLTLLGLLFAAPMIVTGRLALSIGLHLGWNVVMNTVLGLPNSGKPSIASLLVTRAEGPAIWTGGEFGPEGGLVVSFTLLLALIAAAAWWGRGRRELPVALGLADPPAVGPR